MKPKEKAKELYDKYDKLLDHQDIYWSLDDDIKALLNVFVDEILKSDPLSPSKFDNKIEKLAAYNKCESEAYEYWNEVKQEINKL